VVDLIPRIALTTTITSELPIIPTLMMRLRKINLIVWSSCSSAEWLVGDWEELLFGWDPICFQMFTSCSRSNKDSLSAKYLIKERNETN